MFTSNVLSLVVLGLPLQLAWAQWENPDPSRFPNAPSPKLNPPYMVDNQHNYFQTAPDKGTQNGPVWAYSGSQDKFLENLRNGRVVRGGFDSSEILRLQNSTGVPSSSTGAPYNATIVVPSSDGAFTQADDSTYWLPQLAPLGSQPLAGSDYKFYRNVVEDYKADNTGQSDASEAINAAIIAGNRCGKECGSTFTQGAIIYFPSGTYKICSPVIQYYYTQFIGDATNPPTIKGCPTFSGIALFDTDPYIPGGYVTQNQFFRHIRNFIFDMTDMPASTDDAGDSYVPTGIHWQVAQATTLQNLVFNMPTINSSDDNSTGHVGIFMENGSGGFTFNGGAIGWRAGSQQYTARGLKFKGCVTAIQMVWDWGFNWQRWTTNGTFIDSSISDVPIGVWTSKLNDAPNIVLDNVQISNVGEIVQQDDGSTLLSGSSGSQTIKLWGVGSRFNGQQGSSQTGDITAPAKAKSLLSNGSLYVQSRPQYEALGIGSFLVATQNGIANNGTGDQANEINTFLLKARASGQIAYFPAGIYQVGSTVYVPTGSRIQGSSWSQIQGAGAYFSDINNPKVMVQVGNKGDVGDIEIVEMRGSTAGAVLMEWNVAAQTQGSAAMWDSHFRVGGGTGTDLDHKTCPKRGFNKDCIAASLMFHLTDQGSGYFENVWAWVADHDSDESVYDSPDKLINQVSIYGARGMLIESQGPSWFYGSGSEHSVLYNYQLYNAKSVYMGHIQTETPYYQPGPVAPIPFDYAPSMAGDPSFADCTTDACKTTWGLRIVDSTDVTIHSAGLYSFFQNFQRDCVNTKDCQERILEVTGSTGVVIYNLFTVATSQIANGIDKSVILAKDVQSGFTTEVSVWVPLPGQDNIGIIYGGTEIWSTPIVTGSPPFILVLPTSHLSSPTTIDPGNYTTSFEYGNIGSTTDTFGEVVTAFSTTVTTVTIQIPNIVVSGIPYSNVNVTGSRTDGGFIASPSVSITPIGVPLPDGNGGTTTRTVQLPPWPDVTKGPPTDGGTQSDPFSTPSSTGTGTFYFPFSTTITATGPTVTTIGFPATVGETTVSCPPQSEVTFDHPRTTLDLVCSTPTSFTFHFDCPSSKVVTFLAASSAVVADECSVVTQFPTSIPSQSTSGSSSSGSTTTPIPVWTTWPPGDIVPVTTSVDKTTPTDDGVIIPCHLWFFNICIDGVIRGWHLILPHGRFPPGPPPPYIRWPTPLATIGPLPPWPEITIQPDNSIDYDDEPDECTTQTASVCSTTLFVTATVTGGTTTTTTSTSTGSCETIEGCSVTNSGTTSSTTTTVACTPTSSGSSLNVCYNDAIIYPQDPSNVGGILSIISAYSGRYEQVQAAGYTAFIWVPALDQETFNTLQSSPLVDDVQYYESYNRAVPDDGDDQEPVTSSDPPDPDLKRAEHNASASYDLGQHQLLRRDAAQVSRSRFWQRSPNSLAKKAIWRDERSASYDRTANVADPYLFWYNETGGYDNERSQGYHVYIINEEWVYSQHSEWQGQGTLELISPGYTFNDPAPQPVAGSNHGTGVAAQINGQQLGTCKRCHVVWLQTNRWEGYPEDLVRAGVVMQLYKAYEDIKEKNLKGKAVINMSFTSNVDGATLALLRGFKWVLDRLNYEQQAVLVAAAGNGGATHKTINCYPARFGSSRPSVNPWGQVKNLIVVGATTGRGYEASFSQTAEYLTTYAPGHQVWAPTDPSANGDPWEQVSGTSYAAPAVAGIAAYLRSLDSPFKTQLEDPARVKQMIQFLAHRSRRMKIDNDGLEPVDAARLRPIAWNGQVQTNVSGVVTSHSCLADYNTIGDWDIDGACDGINSDMSKMGNGESTGSCGANGGPAKRDDGGSCPLDPNGGDDGSGTFISFTSGATASPTCGTAAGCGGTVCTGYYCAPDPTGTPPDFWDPKDPNNGMPRTTTAIPTSSSPTSSTTSPTPQPSQAVYIYFTFKPAPDGSGNPAAARATWKWLEVVVGQTTFEVCVVGVYEVRSDSTLKNLGWPPTMTADVDVWGRSNCKYTGNSQGAGQLQCDGVPQFQCYVDPQWNQQLYCNDTGTIRAIDRYIPRVRCEIPGTDGMRQESLFQGVNANHTLNHTLIEINENSVGLPE
ncbi:glycoside hydrolase family 55 protein [Xylaria sp. FL0933]|nr:glycoside hydrolase family 55 protein [Xylaria sp. FL0933]